MSKIAVISSGKYTSFCHSFDFLQDISCDLDISIFAPSFNELTASIHCKSVSFHRIEKKPIHNTYKLITNIMDDCDTLVLVFSKFLIPASVFSNYDCVNFHPSVLPSYPGLSGYKDALSNHHLGFTAHKIDDSVDQGSRILSCQITPFPDLNADSIDVISFQMCSLLSAAIIRIFNEGRLNSMSYQHYSSSTFNGLVDNIL